MQKFFSALALVLATAIPAGATPQNPDYVDGGQCAGDVYSKCRYTLEIVNPEEEMVVVPGLEFLGASRISTVEFCSEIEYIEDWKNLMTDEDLLNMEACLIEHT
jgi:hypothetical protein